MNILRLSTLSLTLAIAFVTLGYVNSSSAAPKTCAEHPRPSCDGEGDSDTNLRAKFDLFIGTTVPQYILSDTGSYPNSSKKHVQVGTGSGPGFRFDTNTQNVSNLSRWMSARFVYMTVIDDTPPTLPYEIDFRFNQRIGLDLGSLDVGESETVAASLQYFGGNQVVGFDALNNGILGFGALNAATPPEAEDCLSDSGPITVTRNTPTQWTLESRPNGTKACRFAIDANGDIECSHLPCGNPPTIIPFKFEFTIDEQV